MAIVRLSTDDLKWPGRIWHRPGCVHEPSSGPRSAGDSAGSRWRALAFVVLLASPLAIGCGDSGSKFPPVYKVQGEVIYEGRPAAGALVVFHPQQRTDDQQPARAYTDEQGRFALTSYQAEDGAAPGEYVVTVQQRPLVQRDGEAVLGPNVLPPKYEKPATSDLKVVVNPQENHLPRFELRR